uniref:PORR domain-containing protein n=1 Tax=Kalanchoe fedtschenkoi TaxID=63787 RepID=A0A7N0VGB7_KALFE
MRILASCTNGVLRFNSVKDFAPSRSCGASFGPFNASVQRRWKKPVSTAQTRLESRTRDLKLDGLMRETKRLKLALRIAELMSRRKKGPFVSMQTMSRWSNIAGVSTGVGVGGFVRKYPHVFDVFTHPVRRNACCRVSEEMKGLIREEEGVVRAAELDAKNRVKRLLMMSKGGRLHVHALRLMRRELGLPEDFVESILKRYLNDFNLVDVETVELVSRNESLCVAQVEKWREKEYTEKWLSEFETMYAFPVSFPTGFKIVSGFRDKLKNWQRLPYIKPFEQSEAVWIRSCGGLERFEKRVVGILHELLSLTVEKMVDVQRLAHFRRDFGIEINIRELILKHPGIFYISTKGETEMVFLREAYQKGCLIMPNAMYDVRMKMIDLLLMGCRNIKKLHVQSGIKEESAPVEQEQEKSVRMGIDDHWVVSILDRSADENSRVHASASDSP